MDVPSEEEQRRFWRTLWLSSIQAFADDKMQRERWANPEERNPVYSYVECMEVYFTDAFMSEERAFERRVAAGRLTLEEVEAAMEFHAEAEGYSPPNGDSYAIEAILADPKWHEVVAKAKIAQQRLLAMLSDPKEIQALTRPLEWADEDGVFRTDLIGTSYVR